MTTAPDVPEEETLGPGSRWPLPVAAVAGLLLGALGREVPVLLALQSGAARTEARSCGMEEAAECAIAHLPAALGALLVVGLAMTVISVLLAAGGFGLVVLGLVRHRQQGRRWAPLLAVAAGTALTVPFLWLLVSFAAAVA